MKKIILGRGEDCDVYLNDTKGLISRKHAIMKINPIGHYEITDVSKNGTFINGIRMKPHIPYKVKRKDVIVFANSLKLDWDDIPDSSKWIKIGLLGMMVLLAVIIIGLVFIFDSSRQSSNDQPLQVMPPIERSIEDPEQRASETSTSTTEESTGPSEAYYPNKPEKAPTEKSKQMHKADRKDKSRKEKEEAINEKKLTEEKTEIESLKVDEEKFPGGD